MNLQKTVSVSGKLLTLFRTLRKVLLVCGIVVAAVLAVLTAVNCIWPDVPIGTDYHMIDVGPLTFELAEDFAPDEDSVLRFAWGYAALGLLCAVAAWFALGCICDILAPMSEGAPFTAQAAGSFKKLAWCSVVLGIAVNVGGVLQTVSALRTWNIEALLAGGAVRGVTANYTLDLGFLVVFFLLMLMHHVFGYAAELQRLSDETL